MKQKFLPNEKLKKCSSKNNCKQQTAQPIVNQSVENKIEEKKCFNNENIKKKIKKLQLQKKNFQIYLVN